MGLSTTTQFRPFGPIFPSFFKFSRSCPCSTWSFSSDGHRRKLVSGVVVDLQRRNEKTELASSNYNTLSVQEGMSVQRRGTRNSWKTETVQVREHRKRFIPLKNECSVDGSSYSVGQDIVRVGPHPVLTNGKQPIEDQAFLRNGALLSKTKYDGTTEAHTQTVENNNVSIVQDIASIESSSVPKKDKQPIEDQASSRNGAPFSKSKYNGTKQARTKTGQNKNVAVEDVNGWATKYESSNYSSRNAARVNGALGQKSEASGSIKEAQHSEIRGVGTGLINGINTQKKPTAVAKTTTTGHVVDPKRISENLMSIYPKILVVDSLSKAKKVVGKLTRDYRHLVHACDTEVAKIDVKQETPIGHGEIICFSIYSGPQADFGNGKSCIWVDVLDGGGPDLLREFAPFFEDPSIKKVWHNYSFDNHVIENYGISLSGFHADTMHMARLWNSSRRTEGGYSLEALTSDPKVMNGAQTCYKELIGKVSMKTIFGKKKLKKDGSEGKMTIIAPVEDIQRNERKLWICYSGLDSISTLQLYESLKHHLSCEEWKWERGAVGKTMFDFYREYWKPFGELLVRMEAEGMLVNRAYLAEIEKVAKAEQEIAVNRFRNWASKYCPDAKYMNVGSDTQLRQLLFGGASNCKDPDACLPIEKTFQVPNPDKETKAGKKVSKFRKITLTRIGNMHRKVEMFTKTSGWPSVSGDALKILAGKVSAEYDYVNDADELQSDDDSLPQEMSRKASSVIEGLDTSAYGTAVKAFDTDVEGIEACHAIASLCEVCSIDSLISNFILPLQGSNVSGRGGRVHCSLNINTETGRLSARRPNLQNQPALEKDRYKIRQAFIAAPGNSLIVADYGQLELRILAHLANCKSMLEAFKAGGDFHSRTAMNMYPHIRQAVERAEVLLEWEPQPGEDKPPVPLLKDAFGSERRKAKMLNFSIAYGKTPMGLAKDWKVSVEEARATVDLWYNERKEVLKWQELRKKEANTHSRVHTLLGRARHFPPMNKMNRSQKSHIERAAINTPVQGSAADVAMCAMLEIIKNQRLKELGWKLLLQVHDEVILEGPTESADFAKAIVVDCMSKPFNGKNTLKVGLAVDAKCAQNWYSAK